MPSEPRFAHLIHQAQRSLFRTVDRELRRHLDITSAQLGVLYFLGRHDGCRLGELSRGLMMNNSAVTGAVNRMSEAGLVRREPVPEDRRAFRVMMTDRGRDMVHRAAPLLATFNARLREGFSTGELDTVRRFLETVTRRFDESDQPDERGKQS